MARMAGGQKLNEFVARYFSKAEKILMNPWTDGWKMKCDYRKPDTFVCNRELGCAEHLSKHEQFSNS